MLNNLWRNVGVIETNTTNYINLDSNTYEYRT